MAANRWLIANTGLATVSASVIFMVRTVCARAMAGIASAADIDRTVSDGLGLRWSFMGPFETIDLNAPGGIADYARRFGPLYQQIAASTPEHAIWDEAIIAKVEAQRRELLPAEALGERSVWRDRRLMALARHKQAMEPPRPPKA